MIFAAPLVLLGLAALPVILLLLRLLPPPPQRVRFPPLALLQDLDSAKRAPHRPPWLLLLLRLLAVALLIVGLAGPSLRPPPVLPGTGPVLIVIDNGWAAANDWPERIEAANRLTAAAAQAGRAVSVLATAPDAAGNAPQIEGPMRPAQAAQRLAALQPQPWPSDRRADTAALQAAPASTRLYIADGITDGAGFPDFLQSLRPDRIVASGAMPVLLDAPRLTNTGALAVHLAAGPLPAAFVAETGHGPVARGVFDRQGNAGLALPPFLANQLTSLAVVGPRTAGGVALLDGTSRTVTVGLAAIGGNAETPFTGTLYFIRRALPAGTQIVTGTLAQLIADKPNLIVLADVPLDDAAQTAARAFVAGGGVLIRFAGPLTAASPDPLTPAPLLQGDRRLGGSLSWARPLALVPFAASSPFAGLSADPSATVSAQLLADPTALDAASVWAALTDGTPLVLGKRIGQGTLVAVLTSANADWSSLALSGLFPEMMARLTGLAREAASAPRTPLPINASLSAFGALAQATGTASIIPDEAGRTMAAPAHPPGLYGARGSVVAFNLAGHVPPVVRAPLPHSEPLTGQAPPIDLGAKLIAAAFLLLILDLAISLLLRGFIRLPGLAVLLALLIPVAAQAQSAALQTELGYILTGNQAVDQVSADGLGFLSADVSARTSAQLGPPAGLNPATDDLGLYPLIYWPVLPDAPALPQTACAALTDYMAHGGLLVIDTAGGDADAPGSGAGFAPGTHEALARVISCLDLPPLQPLTAADILAHCFYIIQSFPGRFVGAPVFIATPSARDADGVTPVIIGGNGWAGAWAHDASGNAEQTPIPGGDAQRVTALRFGVNLVIYALTGSYKADQPATPMILDRLGH